VRFESLSLNSCHDAKIYSEQILALADTQSDAVKSLDATTQSNFNSLLQALQDHRQAISEDLSAQTRHLESIELQTRHNIRDATQETQRKLQLHHDSILLSTASDNSNTKTAVISELERSKLKDQQSRRRDTARLSARIEEQGEQSRSEIIHALEVKHNILRERIERLEEVMLSKTQELKEIIIATGAARVESSRDALKSRGHSVTVVLRSLQVLYEYLQVSPHP
jgi:hypothetical protein